MPLPELVPLVQPAAEAARGFNWTSVSPITVGALIASLIALCGVLLTVYITYVLKIKEFDRQEIILMKQRIYESSNKYMESLKEVNKVYMDFLISSREILKLEYNCIDMINDVGHYSTYPPSISLVHDFLKTIDEYLEKYSDTDLSTTMVAMCSDRLQHIILWHNDTLETKHIQFLIGSSEDIFRLAASQIIAIRGYIKKIDEDARKNKDLTLEHQNHYVDMINTTVKAIDEKVSELSSNTRDITSKVRSDYNSVRVIRVPVKR